MTEARGEFVVVYDAEDRPHPTQLRAALDAFAAAGPRLGVAQAPLRVDNPDDGWISRQFAVEYAIQFEQVLPLLSRLGAPFPLGGTSNHIRRAALEEAGGWDPHNVTEDADLGFRLARFGWRAQMIAPPTLEEAPVSLPAWLGQRSRWIKGHLQTWLVLMRRPRRAWRELGPLGFCAVHATLGAALAGAVAAGPLALWIGWGLLQGRPIAGADLWLALFGAAAMAQGALVTAVRRGDWRHALTPLTLPAYWLLSTLAALRALFDLALRPHHWIKTAHGRARRRTLPAWMSSPTPKSPWMQG